jgi:murein DD-endopeptidase MepM/ murein hydrolase activator NlpD
MEQLTGERRSSPPRRGIALERYGMQQAALSPSTGELVLPVAGRISSPYGWRNDPFSGERDFHHGIDIAGPAGSGVCAAGSGRVIFSGWKEGYGNVVEIDHGGTSTLYAHNDKNLVAEGEEVRQFQMVALMGDSGRSTGPHLHYEVRKQGEMVDPETVTRIRNSALYANRL